VTEGTGAGFLSEVKSLMSKV